MTPTSAAACTWDGTSAMRAVELELGLLGAGSCPASNKGAKGCARASGTALYAHPCLQHDDLRNVSSPQECYDERPPAPAPASAIPTRSLAGSIHPQQLDARPTPLHCWVLVYLQQALSSLEQP